MRVSTKLFNSQQVRGFQDIRSEMQGIQEKIASGKNINRASDDPVGAVNLSVAKEQKEVISQFLKNNCKRGDIFLTLGAGNITNWVNNLSYVTDKPG